MTNTRNFSTTSVSVNTVRGCLVLTFRTRRAAQEFTLKLYDRDDVLDWQVHDSISVYRNADCGINELDFFTGA